MARRLLDAGHDLAVWNRTRAKAEPLAGAGAKVVDRISDLAQADLVFIMVSTPADLEEVVTGPGGLLSAARRPRMIVDCSSVGADTSARVREAASACGVEFLAAPVSGNPHVVAEGQAVMIASGPQSTYDVAEPYLRSIVKMSVWGGADEQARLVKICHNLYLGLLVQSLSEVTTLAEKSGCRARRSSIFSTARAWGPTGFGGELPICSLWTGRPLSPPSCCARTLTSGWPQAEAPRSRCR